MWASLLSGGHATYGGLRTFEPYDADVKGVFGYFDAARAGKLIGAYDFIHIHTFFNDTGLTLAGFEPDDACVGNTPARRKCAHTSNTYLIYLANPSGNVPETDTASGTIPDVTLQLPDTSFNARWFGPTDGLWHGTHEISGGLQALIAPGAGDWILWIQKAI